MNLSHKFGKVLVLAAHADDETLGCGATIAKLTSANVSCHIHVLTGIGDTKHPLFNIETIENIRCEFRKAINHLGSPKYSFANLPAALLNDIPTHLVNSEVKRIIEKIQPTTIFAPSSNDLHLDHKIINYALRVAARPYLKSNSNLREIFEYEVLSETNIFSDQPSYIFQPNLYIDINDFVQNKLDAFSEYKSQMQESNQPRSIEGIRTLAMYRGLNVGFDFAEAFKIIYQKL